MADYKQHIWDFMKSKIGNEYGVAGLMGNLYAESGLSPTNLQNTYETSLGMTDAQYTTAVDNGSYSESEFVNDSAGYGLAQWTYYSRKQLLYNEKVSAGVSIGDIDLQLNFLYWELQNSYPTVLRTLETATTIRQASDVVLLDFERPADQSESVQLYRASLGQSFYNELTGTGGGGGGGGGGVTIPRKRMSKILLYEG